MSHAPTTGVLTVACGDPIYGRLAYNCAVSLKLADPTLPIALAHTPSAIASLDPARLAIFDHLIDASEHCRPDDDDFIRPKALLDRLTPFERTLFLDADTLWCPGKDPRALTRSLEAVDYTAMNYTRVAIGDAAATKTPYTWWAPPDELAGHYGLTRGWLYQQSTTLVWFQRSTRVDALFATIRELYDHPRQLPRVMLRDMRPDEVYYNVACNLSGVEPHALGFQPVYFFFAHHAHPVSRVLSDYWAITTAGKYHSEAFIALVERVISDDAAASGRPMFPFERRYSAEVLERERRRWAGSAEPTSG